MYVNIHRLAIFQTNIIFIEIRYIIICLFYLGECHAKRSRYFSCVNERLARKCPDCGSFSGSTSYTSGKFSDSGQTSFTSKYSSSHIRLFVLYVIEHAHCFHLCFHVGCEYKCVTNGYFTKCYY